MKTFDNILLDIYDHSLHPSPPDFNEYLLGTLKNSLHFDSAAIADLGVTRKGDLHVQALHLHAVPAEKLLERQTVVGVERLNEDGSLSSRDAALKRAYLQRGNSVSTDIAEIFSEPEVQTYCKKYETAHSLTLVSDTMTAGVTSVVSLWRGSKRNVYSPEHSHVANRLLPHILQARRINARLARLGSAGAGENSTVLANFNGCIHFSDQPAIALLQLEWKQWTPPFLPSQLIAGLKNSKEKVFHGKSISAKAIVQGNLICLTIVPISRQNPKLSSAEYRVAVLAAQGLRYKGIAKELGVSPATVRNQLHAAYRKLGVSNKTALALALPSRVFHSTSVL